MCPGSCGRARGRSLRLYPKTWCLCSRLRSMRGSVCRGVWMSSMPALPATTVGEWCVCLRRTPPSLAGFRKDGPFPNLSGCALWVFGPCGPLAPWPSPWETVYLKGLTKVGTRPGNSCNLYQFWLKPSRSLEPTSGCVWHFAQSWRTEIWHLRTPCKFSIQGPCIEAASIRLRAGPLLIAQLLLLLLFPF